MRIVVLMKPVPDPASMGERLGPDGRLDRAAVPAVVNGNDEYALEAALKLVEAHGGEVTLLSMAPATAPETMRKALAMGATSGTLVTDPALAGSCVVSTASVLAAALKTLEFDLVLAGVDTSDGVAGTVRPGRRRACRPAAPVLRRADRTRHGRAAPCGSGGSRRPATTCSKPRCPRSSPAPRRSASRAIRPSRGSWAPGSKEIATLSLADLGLDAVDRSAGPSPRRSVVGSRQPPARAATRVIREAPDEAARQVLAYLVERRLI